MAARPTIADVARAAGVSRGAVSFALNDRPGVADATRARILAVAAELGFTPSHRARALSSSRALTVGLVIARQPETLSADPFFPAFIAGIEKTLAERGQALLLQVVPDQESERRNYESSLPAVGSTACSSPICGSTTPGRPCSSRSACRLW